MALKDQEIRTRLIENGIDNVNEEIDREMYAIDRANTARMKEILTEHGWPISAVGTEGAEAAFLIVQHADQDPAFQEDALRLLIERYARGEAAGAHVALLTDRVLLHAGKPQRYGTQVVSRGEVWTIPPIEDEANLDARRREMGLAPMDDYVREIKLGLGVSLRRQQIE